MKKLLGLLLIFATSITFACKACECPYKFFIVLKNATTSNCHVIQHDIKLGTLYPNDASETILPAQESPPYDIGILFRFAAPSFFSKSKITALGADSVMSVQCGEDKFVTFESKKDCSMDKDGSFSLKEFAITGTVLALANMDATYTQSQGDCTNKASPQPGTIYWTLY